MRMPRKGKKRGQMSVLTTSWKAISQGLQPAMSSGSLGLSNGYFLMQASADRYVLC